MRGFSVALLEHLGDVRAVAAGAQRDRVAGLGVDAELVLLVALREDLLGALGVSSSGARSGGSVCRSSPRSRYGPYLPTRTTMSLRGIGTVLISRASMSPRCFSTSVLQAVVAVPLPK